MKTRLKQIVKKVIPLSFINGLKRYLISAPFERGSSFNGRIKKHYKLKTMSSRKLCIFSHFDKGNMIDEYVVYYLQSLHQEGFDIIFVSTAQKLVNDEIKKIESYCCSIILKENVGYDFGAWQTAMIEYQEQLDDYSLLLLCNDSVYAPLYPLKEMFSQMQGKYDFWGVTDSYEIAYHIQSYFMVFDKRVFSSQDFMTIWKNYKVYKKKRNIILKYEIGLSQKLLGSGYSGGAYCSFQSLNTDLICNSTHYFWKELIRDLKAPMLKVELLRDNPQKIDIYKWDTFITTHTTFDSRLISKHLLRVKNI